MPKVFQILHGRCHWQTPFQSLAETQGKYPADCLFVEAPDYVNEQWGFDDTEIGDARFIKPVPPEGFIYDDETGQMYPEAMLGQILEETQNAKQNENNEKLAAFLAANPLTWSDGKKYGVSLADQNEIAMNILSYQMAVEAGIPNPILEWHAVHEACVPWTLENLSALSLYIRQYVYPWYQLNQTYKTQIFACTETKQVQAIELVYAWPEDQPTNIPETGEENAETVVDASEQTDTTE